MPAFTWLSVDVPRVQALVERLYSTLQTEDLPSWQAFFDAFASIPYQAPVIRPDGTPHTPGKSIVEFAAPELSRDAIPDIGEPLAAALRSYVAHCAEFRLRGLDELWGHFIDWLPGAGFLRDPEHVHERKALDLLLFHPPHGIPDPFDFLEVAGPTSLSSLLSPEQVGEVLAVEEQYGLLAYLGTEVPRKYPRQGRDFGLLLPFLQLLSAAGLGLYYHE